MQKSEAPEESDQQEPSTKEPAGGVTLSPEKGAENIGFATHGFVAGGDIVIHSVDRLVTAKPGDVQQIAASQIELLNGYYHLVLSQAGRSFRWALIAAGIGLLFFLAAVTFLVIRQPQQLATISLISGALIEVISGINFYLYGKTSAQLAEFHSRLDITQRFLLANSLCETLDDESRNRERSELIRKIAGINHPKL